MAKVMPVSRTCALCGAASEQMALTATRASDDQDLDFRPTGQSRGDMLYWIEECPRCGYISEDLSRPAGVDAGFLESDLYVLCPEAFSSVALACGFYRRGLVEAVEGHMAGAARNYLYGAWACDDAKNAPGAFLLRSMSLLVFQDHWDRVQMEEQVKLCLVADLLRRLGYFGQCAKWCGRYLDSAGDVYRDILAFQQGKALAGDSGVYRVSQITRQP